MTSRFKFKGTNASSSGTILEQELKLFHKFSSRFMKVFLAFAKKESAAVSAAPKTEALSFLAPRDLAKVRIRRTKICTSFLVGLIDLTKFTYPISKISRLLESVFVFSAIFCSAIFRSVILCSVIFRFGKIFKHQFFFFCFSPLFYDRQSDF